MSTFSFDILLKIITQMSRQFPQDTSAPLKELFSASRILPPGVMR